MNDDYTVLIIEDDFRVAEVNRHYVEKVDGFRVTGIARSAKEAIGLLEKSVPDLILLDFYIPDTDGAGLFHEIRSRYQQADIIAVTAANEAETVRELLRGGVFDLILKPFDDGRFKRTLESYRAYRERLSGRVGLSQEEIDGFTGHRGRSDTDAAGLPKGIDPITLNEINRLFREEAIGGITAAELSRQIGTSRSTARRYLEYLVSEGLLTTKSIYGTVGRPERQYLPK
ncbi:response regulator [Edaphobacillus lindanitolerans]|uniref:Two-component system, CitB family, response regulator/two-component system, CitB family, response regulator CitT n=1 Tax=Edaphobacillus lindanitolerans TaxID=550447 RepID=A0A1U7PQP2_9BACI|nr:response regulator [Edaphobacillus lindanitolerans]SIT87132.1 two-component system, CitB family, response regulator/two-component system, CitB family, response regulator CitT [Edaphobacillus lindanitolerans]